MNTAVERPPQVISPQLFDERLPKEKRYWLHKLSDYHGTKSLPLDFIRPVAFCPPKAEIALEVDAQLSARLLLVCAGSEELVLAVLIAVMEICIHKYTGERDVIVGTTIHNRHAEVAALNRVLAIRGQVCEQESVRQHLMQVKRNLAEAYANQKYPFHRILGLLEINESINRQPLFDVAVVLSNINDASHLGELKTDLNLICSIGGKELTGTVEYNPTLFKPQTVRTLIRHFHDILSQALNRPDAAVGELDLMSEETRRELVENLNHTTATFDLDRTIHKLFETQAQETPDAIAVECKGTCLTFCELDKRANQMAHYLVHLGVKPNDLVGIVLEHSFETLVALLGVLKAGAAYLPLDSSHPQSRLTMIIKDAAVKVLLTQQRLLSRVPGHLVESVCLDAQWHSIGKLSDECPGIRVSPNQVAYVIYTSGSSGEPKGVEIEHRSLINYLLWSKETYLRGESLAFSLYSSLAFDLTVTSIFVPLITGNRLIVYPDDGLEHPLIEVLRANCSGVLKVTPSHLSMVRDRGIRADGVRRLIVGGEAFSTDLAREACRMFSDDVEIFNEYGPTEATVGCTAYEFSKVKDDRPFVPIGTPVGNTQVYVLDEHGRPVAENVIGELFIGGVGLARGYVNHPQLTADSFLNSSLAPLGRIYRTGDLARWLPERVLEFIGRRDGQIKFHGYRIQLGEIRAALSYHPSVTDNLVVVQKDGNGCDVLVAYYVAKQPVDTADLRAFLMERLIEETIPNIFCQLPAIPLTANGKINFDALPSPGEIQRTANRAPVLTRTQTEELLAGIWSQALGIADLDITADFFELGGHSLLAHQIISRARLTFQVEVPLRTLFDAATVKNLAGVIDRMKREQSGLIMLPLAVAKRGSSAPLSFAQERLWFMDQLKTGTTYNLYPAFELEGALNVAALEQSVNEIIRRHESLRTTIQVANGTPAQVIATKLELTIGVTDLRSMPESEMCDELDRITEKEMCHAFKLSEGPLIRVALVRTGVERHLLFVSMHHIVSDAVSMGLFYRELAELYSAFCTRAVPKLPHLPIQFGDYAVWQREWLQGEVLERELEFWRAKLFDVPEILDLLPQRTRPTKITDEGTYHHMLLSSELSERVKEVSRHHRCTLFMTLLAVFNVVLYHFSKREDIVIGADVANRHSPEVQPLIGFFVNTLVLRTDLAGNPKFSELLSRVRQVTLDGLSHQDLPFEKLVRELNPTRVAAQNPLFQIMFGFLQESSVLTMELPGLVITPVPLDNETAPFDFSLYMANTPAGIGGTARYKTDLYDASTVTRVLESFELVLETIVARPEVALADIDIVLTLQERQKRELTSRQLRESRSDQLKRIRPTQAAGA